MRVISFFLSWILSQSEKIKHINAPSCKNCVYFRPSLIGLRDDSIYTFGKCHKFGEKDVVSDKIRYTFADMCRTDEFKCGFRGKYFVQEKYAPIRAVIYKMIILSYYVIAIVILGCYGYIITHK